MEEPGFIQACWLHITSTKRLAVKALQKSRFEDIVLQYELDMKLLLNFLPPGFEDPFFQRLHIFFPFEGRGFVRRWAETFLNM